MKPQVLACSALLVFSSLSVTSAAADAALAWPEVTSETRPWSRWWWLGNITTEDDLRTLMADYAAVGLGGLEVTPIYGVRGHEPEFIPFLTPTFMDRLEFAGREAKRHGMQIDMSTGTGWPFGGPWVDDAMASRFLDTRAFDVAAGGRLQQPVTLEHAPQLRFAGLKRVPLEAIKHPVTANENLQELAIDQVRWARPMELHTLMAFPKNTPGQGIELTARVGKDGVLDWTAPTDRGDWVLRAVFSGWHGKMVERAGPGGEGMAIDHFSAEVLAKYLAPFDAAMQGRRLEGFRAWFNDSYEVDDAQGEANFTAKFFDEFQKRRGYDLRQHLPVLLDGAWEKTGDRVRCDYRETISDLLLEEFTAPWRAWAASKQAIIRNQAHGSPANILDLYAASDIPETEGTDIQQFKTASSAAHLTGKRLTSAEALTWHDEHWLSSLGAARRAIDGYFLGGVNHICYHGTVYSPPSEPWPGFHFYAAVEFAPSNPLWEHFPALNAYVTRAQSFLQRGSPDERLLVYYNIHERWTDFQSVEMPHFHGSARDGMPSHAAGTALLNAGYGFDLVTDRMLADVRAEGRALVTDHARYEAILVPKARLMPLESLERLIAYAAAGATVIFEGGLPADVPGYARLTERQEQLRLLQARATRAGVEVADTLVGALRARPEIRRESMVDAGLRFVRRLGPEGTDYFVVNTREEPFDGWVQLGAPAASVALLDPMTGAVGMARRRDASSANAATRLQLAAGQSMLVRALGTNPAGPAWSYWQDAAKPVALDGTWALTFVRGGPTLPSAATVRELTSWTDLDGDTVKAFSGTARYAISFDRPSVGAAAYALDLGRVAESARVVLNGRDLGVLFDAPFRLVLPGDLLAERNTLEIEVINLGANRIADLDRRGVPWKKFYNVNMPAWRRENRGADGLFTAASWEPRVSGLLGPVTLTPLRAD